MTDHESIKNVMSSTESPKAVRVLVTGANPALMGDEAIGIEVSGDGPGMYPSLQLTGKIVDKDGNPLESDIFQDGRESSILVLETQEAALDILSSVLALFLDEEQFDHITDLIVAFIRANGENGTKSMIQAKIDTDTPPHSLPAGVTDLLKAMGFDTDRITALITDENEESNQ